MSTAAYADVASVLKGTVSPGSPVTVRGWVRTRRDSKAGLSFIHVHDGSCFDPIQVVAPATLPNYESEIRKLTSGCSVVARGVVTASQGQGQAVELQAESVEVVGWVDDPEAYPIQPKRASFEYLREVAHLRPRTNTLGAVARVRHALSMAVHRYFHEHGFFWVHTPIITASDAEGAGEMFRVSTLDLANRASIPQTPDGRTDFAQDFFGEGSVPDGQRPVERGDVLPARCRRSTRSVRRSAPRTATPAAISPSSGWWSRRSRLPISTTTRRWPSRSSNTSCRRC